MEESFSMNQGFGWFRNDSEALHLLCTLFLLLLFYQLLLRSSGIESWRLRTAGLEDSPHSRNNPILAGHDLSMTDWLFEENVVNS